MKATIKFNIEIEIDITLEKDIKDVSVMELELKASNLGNCLFDTLKHTKTYDVLNEKINKDYKANIVNINSLKERKITL